MQNNIRGLNYIIKGIKQLKNIDYDVYKNLLLICDKINKDITTEFENNLNEIKENVWKKK